MRKQLLRDGSRNVGIREEGGEQCGEGDRRENEQSEEH